MKQRIKTIITFVIVCYSVNAAFAQTEKKKEGTTKLKIHSVIEDKDSNTIHHSKFHNKSKHTTYSENGREKMVGRDDATPAKNKDKSKVTNKKTE
jgi:uncharacterized protein YxeA